MFSLDMDIFKEGKAKIYAQDIQLKKAMVFYNSNRIFDRSLNVLLISAIKKRHLKGLELFSGSGVRGIRLLLETKNFDSFVFNDIKTYEFLLKNLKLNNLNKKASITNLNAKFYESDMIYDYIDIDPFGSPIPYVENAFKLLKKDGLLAVSATDTAALLGSAQRACIRKYASLSLKTSYSNELGIRILIKRIAELAEERGIHVRPILFNFEGNFIRIYFSLSSRKIGKIGYAYQCSKCPSRTLVEEERCDYCGSKMIKIGKLWLDSIFSRQVVSKMILNLGSQLNNENTDLKDYLSTLLKEKDIFSYYTTSEIASFFKEKEKKISKFKDRTVLSQKGFKTNLSFKDLITSLKD